MEHKQGFVCIL